MQVVVRTSHNLGIGQVEVDDFTFAFCIFADELDVVALAIYGQVACHSECFEDVDLLVVYGECARAVHFAQNRNFVVGHADSDDGTFVDVGTQFFTNHVFGFVLGQAADLDTSQYREVDVAFIVYQVLLQGRLLGEVVALCRVDGGLNNQIERDGGFGDTCVHRDGEQVLRHNLGIVHRQFAGEVVHSFGVLQIRYVLVSGTAAHP